MIAASYFNKLAAERGLSQRAITRGTVPDAVFGPKIVSGLQEDGVSVPAGIPQLVSAADLSAAEQVITFAVNLPAGLKATKRQQWNDVPSTSVDYKAARTDIARRVELLISELSATHKH